MSRRARQPLAALRSPAARVPATRITPLPASDRCHAYATLAAATSVQLLYRFIIIIRQLR